MAPSCTGESSRVVASPRNPVQPAPARPLSRHWTFILDLHPGGLLPWQPQGDGAVSLVPSPGGRRAPGRRVGGEGPPAPHVAPVPQVCKAAASSAGPALHRPQVPGTPLLLQTHRGHAHRHLPHGDAGSPAPNDLGPWPFLRTRWSGRSARLPAALLSRACPAPPLPGCLDLGAWPVTAKPEMCCHPRYFQYYSTGPGSGHAGVAAGVAGTGVSPGGARAAHGVSGPRPRSYSGQRVALFRHCFVVARSSVCRDPSASCVCWQPASPASPTIGKRGQVGGVGISLQKTPPAPWEDGRGSGASSLVSPQNEG